MMCFDCKDRRHAGLIEADGNTWCLVCGHVCEKQCSNCGGVR